MDTFDLLNEACDLYIKALSEGCCKKESCCKSEECNKDESCEKNEGCCKKENCDKSESCNESVMVLDESAAEVFNKIIDVVKQMIETVKKKVKQLITKVRGAKEPEQGAFDKYTVVIGSSFISDKKAAHLFHAFINSFQAQGGDPSSAWDEFDKCFSDDPNEAYHFTYWKESKQYIDSITNLMDYSVNMAESKVRSIERTIESENYNDDDLAMLNNCKFALMKLRHFTSGNFEVRGEKGQRIGNYERIDVKRIEVGEDTHNEGLKNRQRTNPNRTVGAYT